MRRIHRALIVGLFIVFISVASVAQVTSGTNDVATPIEGKGHDYIKLLSETVSPSNGSVSLRIELPVPESRGFTVPFAIAYDSSTEHHLIPSTNANPAHGPIWTDNYAALAQGGWSYTIPQISWNEWDQPHVVFDQGGQPVNTPCKQSNGYLLRGIGGETYSLYMGGQYFDSAEPEGGCSAGNAGSPLSRSNGDWADGVWGTLPTRGFGQYGNTYYDTWPQMVGDKHGYIFSFSNRSSFSMDKRGVWPVSTLPDAIEDRNGNRFTFSMGDGIAKRGVFTATDTNRRTMYSSTTELGTSGTITVGGKSYGVGWANQSATFDVDHIWVKNVQREMEGCADIKPSSDTATVISQIDLPQNSGGPQLSYRFWYGSNSNPEYQNPYGLLSEINYPSGAWVKYKWKQSDEMSDVIVYSGWECVKPWSMSSCAAYGPVADICGQQYKSPVVASREVGLAGSSMPILTQTFSYKTTWDSSRVAWTSKTTSVTTTDNTGRSALIVYTYVPKFLSNQPFEQSSTSKQVAVEDTIKYYDWGDQETATPLKTVVKTWSDQYRINSEQTILKKGSGTVSSLRTFAYNDPVNRWMPSEVVEYDYDSSILRRTTTEYQNFVAMPSGRTLLDKPCRTIVYDGSGNRVAETDYHYDDRTATCGAISGEWRGNLTQVVRCFGIGTGNSSGCSSSSPTTTYTYDSTGQVNTRTDAKGTTTYTYDDAHAFVTGIDYPKTNGVGHAESFTYDYANSLLTTKTGQNTDKTSYEYDNLRRPTKIVNPDHGETTIGYDDTPPNPSITQRTSIDAGNSLVTVTKSDGLGRVIQTQVGSGALATTVDMTYDGLGRLRTKSNPYRSSPNGTTTYDYDALGRVKLVTNPDGSTVITSYNNSTVTSYPGYCTTVTDEAKKRRISCTDALGRVTRVVEAPSN